MESGWRTVDAFATELLNHSPSHTQGYSSGQFRSPDLTEQIKLLDSFPVAGGNYSDIYRGLWSQKTVCLRALRVRTSLSGQQLLRRFRREEEVWSRLNHPHILPLHGVCVFGSKPYMVTEWVPNGNALDYTQEYPSERERILLQVAQALHYLHSGIDFPPVVHGDVKAENVLITDAGNALLNDFGLARFADDAADLSGSILEAGTISFMAPELLRLDAPEDEENAPKSTKSDVYAFGSLVFQLGSGKQPYGKLGYATILFAVHIQRKLPPRPPEFPDNLWDLCQSCWAEDCYARPTMATIVLRMLSGDMRASLPEAEEDAFLSSPLLPPEDVPTPNRDSPCTADDALAAELSSMYLGPPANVEIALEEEVFVPRRVQFETRDLSGMVALYSRQPIGMGGFGEVFLGHMGGQEVAMKVMRVPTKRERIFERDLTYEAYVWSSLSHQYILPLLGICEIDSSLFLISPFMGNGTAVSYCKDPSVDREKILRQVAEALAYLHSVPTVVHGDVKGANVLISGTGDALLSDFGLSRCYSIENKGSPAFPYKHGAVGTIRFMAPELLLSYRSGEPFSISTMTDVYAFGMLITQLISGEHPMHYLRRQADVIEAILGGERPVRVHEFDDKFWNVCVACWDPSPERRPTMTQVLKILR